MPETLYVTAAQFVADLNVAQATDADVVAAVNAASRSIDDYCGQTFWIDDSATARVYTAEWSAELVVANIATTTGLVVKTDDDDDGTFENTWTADTPTDVRSYGLEPQDAQHDTNAKRPYTALVAVAGAFPTTRRGVEVTAKWGWPAVPSVVTQAAWILARRFWKRKDAPFAVIGSPDTGVVNITRTDPDVARLLRPVRRFSTVGAA